MSEIEAPSETQPRVEPGTHAEWWASGTAPDVQTPAGPDSVGSPYTDAQAAASLRRAGVLVVVLTCVALPVAWLYAGWRGAAALAVGAAISGSGLWEWRRLMAALTAKMDAQEAVQPSSANGTLKAPSIGFAIAGFVVRLLVVVAVLYASLKYLHGSVPALAAGLAMGVVALTVEAIRLLRSGTI
jgi:hypothetical protein